jgi:hypothetical protein
MLHLCDQTHQQVQEGRVPIALWGSSNSTASNAAKKGTKSPTQTLLLPKLEQAALSQFTRLLLRVAITTPTPTPHQS